MVSAEDAVGIYQTLAANGIRLWLTGGWGIDALLGYQTRPHKDLDVLMLVDDVAPMRRLLSGSGYILKELWSENLPAVDSQGAEVQTAFVLRDSEERELDAHALRFDQAGHGVPAWANEEGLLFGGADLSGKGMIAGLSVECVAAGMQLLCHTGYDLPEYQRRDLALLRERFGLGLSAERGSL